MIERFHRQLKVALRAYPDQQRWSEYVPVVLLGCRVAIKEDLGYSPTELVYGVPLSLPGQTLNPIDLTTTDPVLYTNRLRAYFSKLPPMHPREQTIKSSVPKYISSWTHVFLRKDAVKAPLTPPYTGPYRVLLRTDKLFTFDISGKKETVSIDRVKRAVLDTNTRTTYPPTYTHEHTLTPVEGNTTPKDNYVTTRRSGPRVRWPPKRYINKMDPSLFLRLLPFSLSAFHLNRGGGCCSHRSISSRESMPLPSDSATH